MMIFLGSAYLMMRVRVREKGRDIGNEVEGIVLDIDDNICSVSLDWYSSRKVIIVIKIGLVER